MKISSYTLPKSLHRLVESIKIAIQNHGQLSPKRAKELVLEADVQVKDMMHYADFDHPVEDCYGRKMVFDGGTFEVMVMSWNPGDYSSIHNHGYTQWGVVQVFGNAAHFLYNEKNKLVSFAKKEILTKGEAIKVNNALIHQMGNPGSEQYLSLHVYGANDMHVPKDVTADARNYDLEFDRVAHTTGGAFFNLPSSEIYDVEENIRCTPAVFVNYANQLLAYYQRQTPSKHITKLKQHVLSKLADVVLD